MELSLVEIVGHIAFLLTAVSFYLKDILLLRFLAIASALVGIGYNYFLPEFRSGRIHETHSDRRMAGRGRGKCLRDRGPTGRRFATVM